MRMFVALTLTLFVAGPAFAQQEEKAQARPNRTPQVKKPGATKATGKKGQQAKGEEEEESMQMRVAPGTKTKKPANGKALPRPAANKKAAPDTSPIAVKPGLGEEKPNPKAGEKGKGKAKASKVKTRRPGAPKGQLRSPKIK